MAISALQKLIQGKLDDAYYTQDGARIYGKMWWAVFVYGTFKRGFSRASSLKRGFYVGEGVTDSENFRMYKYAEFKNDVYPVTFMDQTTDKGNIKGEVYLVPPMQISELDYLERNGVYYKRQVRVVRLQQDTGEVKLPALMYVGYEPNWVEIKKLNKLTPLPRLTAKKTGKGYYQFRRIDV